MIRNVHLRNFKTFLNDEIAMAPLTILAGVNASGKSSLIQSVCLARDLSADKNGDSLDRWNNLKKLKSKLSIEDYFQIDIQELTGHISVQVHDITAEGSITDLRASSDLKKPGILSYIAADRLGPRDQLPDKNHHDVFTVGPTGENVISVIDKFLYCPVPEKLQGSRKDNNFLDCINEWLQHIAPDNKLTYTKDPVRGIFFPTYNGILPTETGYGLGYSLPVITELLLFDQEDKVLLLENPEAHLHPKAQSCMGELISTSVSCGKQIIVETHSDHIINGIRLAIKRGMIDHQDVHLLFFEKGTAFDAKTKITDILFDRHGELSCYPVGLLDEWGELMSQLF